MLRIARKKRIDPLLLVGITVLISFSILILRSIAPFLFPTYFLYVFFGILAFIFFSQIDFEIISLFSNHLYVLSIFFLILPLLIGKVTRGAVRWIPLGPLTIQPAEIVRPFLIVFFANYLLKSKLDLKSSINILVLLFIPSFLILIQPSLGVTILTLTAFLGVLLASSINKKYIAIFLLILVFLTPVFYKVLAPYQQQRVRSFLNPSSDPTGAGYNSIQSMIAVGSGKIFGEGLGKGGQTQLAFLPEKHTDFIFAAISEEMGFVGSLVLLLSLLFVLWRLSTYMEIASSAIARAYVAGVFLSLFVQTVVNVGMNLGMLPITGLPLPLVSAGGSSFMGVMISLGIVMGAKKNIRS